MSTDALARKSARSIVIDDFRPKLTPNTDEFESSFYRTLLDNLHDGVYFVDQDRRITYWNRGAERITGYRADEVIGSRCRDNLLVHVDDGGCELCHTKCPLVKSMQDRNLREADVFLRHKDGSRLPVKIRVAPIADKVGRIVGAVETFSDNSSQLAATEMARRLGEMVYYDSLTEIGNRRFADMRLREDLGRFHETGNSLSLLFVDVDEFKGMNDRFGHEAGDRILHMTARTLAANVRPCDFVGRWGGDEFVVVLIDVGPKETRATARRLRALIAASRVRHENQMLGVTVSIGATTASPDDTTKSLTRRADELLYCSKREGRDRVTCYFPEQAEHPAVLTPG
jgi:diguanylate cyclase (GGDEF)-like protein/PAS domain S-box-containing protein